MADFTGIQAVTETLRQLLLERMQEHSALTDVTTFHPDHDDASRRAMGQPVSLRRRRRTPHSRTRTFRTRSAALARQARALLDLHYLITTAGLDRADTRARGVCSATPW